MRRYFQILVTIGVVWGWGAGNPLLFAQGGLAANLGGPNSGPMMANPAAVFWNPGALGGTKGPHLLVDVQTVFGQGQYLRMPDEYNNFGPYPQVDATALFPVPFIGATHDFGLEKWRFGGALYVPFGAGGGWGENGPQRYHLIRGAEGSLFLTAAAAYKFNEKVSAGLGVSYLFSFLQGSVALDLAPRLSSVVPSSVGGLPLESPLFTAEAKTGVMYGHGYTINGGVFIQPTPYLDLGFSFQLPAKVTVQGPIGVTLPDVLALGAPYLSFLEFDGRTLNANGQITNYRPLLLNAGAAFRPYEKLTLEFMVVYAMTQLNNESRFELFGTGFPILDSPEGTQVRSTGAANSYQLKFGAKYLLSQEMTMGGFISFIDPGVPQAYVSASNVGFNTLIPTWFYQYNFAEENILGLSISPFFVFTQNISNSIYDPEALAGSGIGLPPANGTYKGFGIQMGVSYTRVF